MDFAEENLYLVAKIIPKHMKTNLKMDVSFKKEIFVFNKLIPAYREIERKLRLDDECLIDLFPKFYGGQLTMDEESPDEAILLMENLKVSGYDTMDRKQGLDLEHAKLALTELARFHALGMALKHHEAALFEEAKTCMREIPFDVTDMNQEAVICHLIKTICQDPRIAKYESRIWSIMPKNHADVLEVQAVEPWVTIVHGDFWVNNIMFRTGTGKVEHVKFIDFQVARTCSPLKDLPYFLYASTSQEVLEKHVVELLDAYYDRFIQVLGQLECDTSPYTRKSFDDELGNVAKRDLFYCLITLKFFTIEMTPELLGTGDIVQSVMMADGRQLFLDRAWMLLSKYIEKGWI